MYYLCKWKKHRLNLGKIYNCCLHTLGFLPKIPFKLTQSIHVALQKTAILKKKMSKYSVFNTETNKGNIGLYFENNEKNC